MRVIQDAPTDMSIKCTVMTVSSVALVRLMDWFSYRAVLSMDSGSSCMTLDPRGWTKPAPVLAPEAQPCPGRGVADHLCG